MAAQKLGIDEIPCVVARGWTAAQKRAYVIADNQLALGSTWDADLLKVELGDLGDLGFDLDLVGFDAPELSTILGGGEDGKTSDLDDAPEVPKESTSWTGDMWILGQHRVQCGHCHSEDDFAGATGGERFDVLLTDPPYCSGGFQEAGRAAGTWGSIASDNLSTRGWSALIRGMFNVSTPQVVYAFTDWRMWTNLHELVECAGLACRSMIVWDKGTPGLGALWRTQHELVMFASRSGGKRQKGMATIGNVIHAQRTGNKNHYTEKPVELLQAILQNDQSAGRSGPVYDPFLGSGSTLIAAEQLGRRCFGVEIEPRYVDVIVRRWQNLTGKSATLEASGDTFDAVARSRQKSRRKKAAKKKT